MSPHEAPGKQPQTRGYIQGVFKITPRSWFCYFMSKEHVSGTGTEKTLVSDTWVQMCPVNSEVWSLGKVMARKINSAILCEWPIIDLQTLIRLARACGGGGSKKTEALGPPRIWYWCSRGGWGGHRGESSGFTKSEGPAHQPKQPDTFKYQNLNLLTICQFEYGSSYFVTTLSY